MNIGFMDEKFTVKNIENDYLNLTSQESDYQNLLNRLKEIKDSIALLEKKKLDKF